MAFNCVKLEHEVTFMKYLPSVVYLILLQKTSAWNKMTFQSSNLLNLAKVMAN